MGLGAGGGLHSEKSFLKNENNTAYLCNSQIQSRPWVGGGRGRGGYIHGHWRVGGTYCHKNTLHDIKLKLHTCKICCTRATSLPSIYISDAVYSRVTVWLMDILYTCRILLKSGFNIYCTTPHDCRVFFPANYKTKQKNKTNLRDG